MKAYGVDVKLHSFSISALTMSDQFHSPVALSRGKVHRLTLDGRMDIWWGGMNEFAIRTVCNMYL